LSKPAPLKRVLVVEDDAAVADELAGALRHMSFEVVGPFSMVDNALASVVGNQIDVAILDVRLGTSLSFPVARYLQAIEVPFLFITGSLEDVGREFASAPALPKPVRLSALRATLDRILAPRPA
jgi:DNA-binding response OmpR family regulator